MKLIILTITVLFNFNCKSNPESISTDYSKGIGLIISENEQISIYSGIKCNSLLDKFNSQLNETNRLFDGLEAKLTNFKNFEYGYEEYFLPVVDILSNGNVYKVIFQEKKSNYRYGYVPVNERSWQYQPWSKFLVDKPLYFIKQQNCQIFEFNEGPEIGLNDSSFSDHIMWPEFERDGWIQVKFVTPSDFCVQESECSKIINGTIEYFDNNGNLIVWYDTRGC